MNMDYLTMWTPPDSERYRFSLNVIQVVVLFILLKYGGASFWVAFSVAMFPIIFLQILMRKVIWRGQRRAMQEEAKAQADRSVGIRASGPSINSG